MHEQNCFITLTYDEENLVSEKLQYDDFQKFMKKLRKAYPNRQIGMFVTGEYGDQKKRPHWHACIFNWQPTDPEYKYSNERGDRIYSSNTLTKLWGKGLAEYGTVTFESAGYCARYAAKKLIHGKDGHHDFIPISKKSSKHAIGKTWLEKFWPDVFNSGQIVLPNGKTCGIPRYYEKWLKEKQPEDWLKYVTRLKAERATRAIADANKEAEQEKQINNIRATAGPLRGPQITKLEQKKKILDQKFNQLQKYLKL